MSGVVEVFFDADQDEGGDRQYKLNALGAEFAGADRLHAPLGSRAVAKAANLREHDEIEQRSGQRQDDHRDAKPIDVKADDDRFDAGGESQRADADSEAEAVERDEEAANALQQGEEEA